MRVILADRQQELVELERLARVEARRRLVEAEQQRVGAHGARDLEAALRAVGKVAGRIVGAVGEVDLVEPVFGPLDRLLLGLAVAADAEHAEEREAGGDHQRIVLRHQQVFENRHAGEQADVLERARDLGLPVDAEAGQPLQQQLRAVGLAQRDHALGRLVEAGDAVEDRGLAGAVRADERGDVAAPGLEAEVVDRHQPAEAHGEVLNVENGILKPAH